jgi:heterodisulfide reductase subunit A-like polyferredoxin/coenzyme F420-reducing hydrogenase delta subunit
MRASSELLEQGFKVFLVEEKPTIGGKMAQIDKMFPTNECATCTILPHMLQLTNNPNLTLLAFSEVVDLDGKPGEFKAKVLKKPRYVDPMKCTACTDCFPACPVGGVPMDFNLGRGASKAIAFYSPFPPRKALIDPEKCDYILKGECGEKEKPPCVEACEPDAIDFTQKPTEVEIDIGAVLVATGLDETGGGLLAQYGYGSSPNILTALEYERLLSGLGPTGGVVKRDDGTEPRSVAWVVLDSDTPIGYMTSVTQAMGTLEKNQDASLSVISQRDASLKDSYAEFISKAGEQNIQIRNSDTISVAAGENGAVSLLCSKNGGQQEQTDVDLLVLVVPLTASSNTKLLAQNMNLDLNSSGFIATNGNVARTLVTSREGVFVCGGAQGTKGIDDSIVQACAAAAQIGELLAPSRGTDTAAPTEKSLFPVSAEDEPSIGVIICRCGANIAGLLDMDELVDYTASLPGVTHVEVTPFGCDGVALKQMIESKQYNRIVMGACSPKTHEDLFSLHAEMGGLNRFLVELVNLRNHCTWVHSKDKKEATAKGKTLMRMGVTRARMLEGLEDIIVSVTPSALVVGATPAGIASAAALANMGLQVHLLDRKEVSAQSSGNGDRAAQQQLDDLQKHPEATIHAATQITNVDGYVGNYTVELNGKDKTEEITVGAIVVADSETMSASTDGRSYEEILGLQRNEQNRFTPKLGVMNLLDFNTEGVFMCGAARGVLDVPDAIIDGEAAASRVAGIITKKQLVKSPSISFVIDDNCDGCAYCIEPCPADAITLIEYKKNGEIKKTVQTNEAICRGCGVCMATCPKKGIFIWHFKPEHFGEIVKSIRSNGDEEYEPRIIAFCCNWCSYAAADSAGTARLQYPANVHIVRAMCSGMIHPNFVMDALTQGTADGVLICGCHIGDCHYQDGNKRAEARADAMQLMLEDFGLEPERFRIEWVSAAEGPTFARIAREMAEDIKRVGPNPYRT